MTDLVRQALADLRVELDALDRSTVEALARRQRIVEAIARLKGDPASVRDPERVEAVLANVLRAAGVFGLSAAIAEPVWRLLVERCADHEAALLQAGAESGASRDSCCGCQNGPAGAGA